MVFVEVIYLLAGQYSKRKYIQYPDLTTATGVYESTIKKMKAEKKQALVCLRNGEQGLIKSELLK